MSQAVDLMLRLRTYLRLGIPNIARVVLYSLLLKTGALRRWLGPGVPISGEFIVDSDASYAEEHQRRLSGWQRKDSDTVFGHIDLSFESPPNWHISVLTHKEVATKNAHWTQLSDFGLNVGDIKGVWEPSRFGWLVPMAQNAIVDKNCGDLTRLNAWISDWSQHNPMNIGPNWKCAQETSFRVLHLAAAAMILGNHKPEIAAADFVKEHIRRIIPTLGYAKAQDNNHGTSEAAALYVGASWLKARDPESKRWGYLEQKAKLYLQERVNRLVMSDGSFSQYSVTYHRLLLDTLNFVELWRRFQNLQPFALNYIERAGNAASWLFLLTDEVSGNAPNLGANDGAHILNFFGANYREFRFSVELACLLFQRRCAYPGVISDTVRRRFHLTAVGNMDKPTSTKLVYGGYGIARNSDSWMMLRVPHFTFRPSQTDALHLDVWHKGVNWLRDGGTFSYNMDEKSLQYFSGSASHNVPDFDDAQQMPKISRFLFGAWPENDFFSVKDNLQESVTLHSACTFWHGGVHERKAVLSNNELVVTDTLRNVKNRALLRWRLAPANWQISENTLSCEQASIKVSADSQIDRFTLAQGYESIYYGKKAPLPVLELAVSKDVTITTIIRWN